MRQPVYRRRSGTFRRPFMLCLAVLLAGGGRPVLGEERKFAVMLAVPRKSMPLSYPSQPLPNPNDIFDHYFDFNKPGVNSFAEYWNEISYGNVHVSGDVLGWVEVPWRILPATHSGGLPGSSIPGTTLGGPRGGGAVLRRHRHVP
jgi:hypothetical protein